VSGWPWWILLPVLFLIIGGGGIGAAFVCMVILELVGLGPDAQRKKREERE
jgi:hypothetical protein